MVSVMKWGLMFVFALGGLGVGLYAATDGRVLSAVPEWSAEAAGDKERVEQTKRYEAQDPPGYDRWTYGHWEREGLASDEDLLLMKRRLDRAYEDLQKALRSGNEERIMRERRFYEAMKAEYEKAKRERAR
ncbi:MAG: hypothetical protein HYY17_16405 [Planctomycetes bacterium]|nr:hypothetical protein [Planctomycetota bacterium]